MKRHEKIYTLLAPLTAPAILLWLFGGSLDSGWGSYIPMVIMSLFVFGAGALLAKE